MVAMVFIIRRTVICAHNSPRRVDMRSILQKLPLHQSVCRYCPRWTHTLNWAASCRGAPLSVWSTCFWYSSFQRKNWESLLSTQMVGLRYPALLSISTCTTAPQKHKSVRRYCGIWWAVNRYRGFNRTTRAYTTLYKSQRFVANIETSWLQWCRCSYLDRSSSGEYK